MLRMIIAFCVLLIPMNALAQELVLEFELFKDSATPDQMLRLEISSPRDPVIVTQRSTVEVPGGMLDDAFDDLMISLLTTPIDEESVRNVGRDDGPYVRLSIETTFERNELSYRQNLLLDRLPDQAIQMMTMFRPFGPPGVAFVARLEEMKAQNRYDGTAQLVEDIEFQDAEIRLLTGKNADLKLQIDQMGMKVIEANLKSQEVPAVAVAKIQQLEDRLDEVFAALEKAQAQDQRDTQLLELAKALDQAGDDLATADTWVQDMGQRLNAALATVAASEQQLVSANAELNRITELPENLLRVAEAIRRGGGLKCRMSGFAVSSPCLPRRCLCPAPAI